MPGGRSRADGLSFFRCATATVSFKDTGVAGHTKCLCECERVSVCDFCHKKDKKAQKVRDDEETPKPSE